MSESSLSSVIPRVLNKVGRSQVHSISVPKKFCKFVKDLVNTLIELSWKRTLLIFLVVYFATWTFFALIYWLIAWAHNDLEFDKVTGKRLHDGREACLKGGDNFIQVFLLSMESQVSTGYGEHYPTEECSEAIFTLIVQLTCGVIIDGCLIGIFYAKMTRPPYKESGMKFSKKAVVCMRDGKLCLIIRVVDSMQQHGIKTKVKAFFLEDRKTMEGEIIEKCQTRLELEQNGKLFLLWPETVCHIIDKNSPFYDISAEQLLIRKLEVMVSIIGDSRKTGQTINSKTSYLSSEILWGHRFVTAVDYDRDNHEYIVDPDKFDMTIQVLTPLCSARQFDDFLNGSKYDPQLEVLRNYEIKTADILEEDDEDDDEFEEENVQDYSEETELDTVLDMVSTSHLTAKTITRTTSVVHNYPAESRDYVSDSASDYSKSLTHIERERELMLRPLRLKKARGRKITFQDSNESDV